MNVSFSPYRSSVSLLCITLELSPAGQDIAIPTPYLGASVLVRYNGEPLGRLELPARDGVITAAALRQAVARELGAALERRRLRDRLALLGGAAPFDGPWPALTAAVCTRNRPEDLARCLAALTALDYPGRLELLVIDNLPDDDRSERLVGARFPQVRYAREDRPGLNQARNRAVREASGDILAFTDDDVVVDPLWARNLARVFVQHPGVMAVTGLVAPLELETQAQRDFERYGGFGRGFERRWYGIDRAAGERAAAEHSATGKLGTGANMAYRRAVFARIGGFDPALDVGTITNGGGDLEMFFRVIKAGFPLVYEPAAIVYHRHRREQAQLRRQIANNGVGHYAYLVRCFLHFHDERLPVLRAGLWWFIYWYCLRLLKALFGRANSAPGLVLAELHGGLAGLGRYQRARRLAEAQARSGDLPDTLVAPGQTGSDLRPGAAALRAVDLARPLPSLDDVTRYAEVLVNILRDGELLGCCRVTNHYQPVSAERLRDAIVEQLGPRLGDAPAHPAAAPTATVAVVLVSRGLTPALDATLADLRAQQTGRAVEIIIVDTAPLPASGAQLPGVRLIALPCATLAHARQAALAACEGELVVWLASGDRVGRSWLEQLVAPLAEPRVAAVAGAWLPSAAETTAQRLAAARVDLTPAFAGPEWLVARPGTVPSWAEGALGNCAMRLAALRDPAVGLPDPRLGPGTPVGAGDDQDLFYRMLRRGHTLVYEPRAYATRWPPEDWPALARQARLRGRGRAAFALVAALRDSDGRPLRALARDLAGAVGILSRHLRALLRGRDDGSLWLELEELSGALAAPVALLRARRAVPPEALDLAIPA